MSQVLLGPQTLLGPRSSSHLSTKQPSRDSKTTTSLTKSWSTEVCFSGQLLFPSKKALQGTEISFYSTQSREQCRISCAWWRCSCVFGIFVSFSNFIMHQQNPDLPQSGKWHLWLSLFLQSLYELESRAFKGQLSTSTEIRLYAHRHPFIFTSVTSLRYSSAPTYTLSSDGFESYFTYAKHACHTRSYSEFETQSLMACKHLQFCPAVTG